MNHCSWRDEVVDLSWSFEITNISWSWTSCHVLLDTPPLDNLNTANSVQFLLKLKQEDDLHHWSKNTSALLPDNVDNTFLPFVIFEGNHQLFDFQEKSINFCTLQQLIGFFPRLRQNIISWCNVRKRFYVFDVNVFLEVRRVESLSGITRCRNGATEQVL